MPTGQGDKSPGGEGSWRKGGVSMRAFPRWGLFMIPALLWVFSLTGCSSGNITYDNNASFNGASAVNDAAKRASLQMTAFCENDPYTSLQFNFAANIGDGSGITFGCIGFTTGTYCGNILIKYYTTLNPNNILAKYIPVLNRIDSEAQTTGGKSNDTAGLEGFINDVQHCTDPLFKQAQMYEVDQLYWNPAVARAASLGAKYPITLAFIYDTCINHGVEGADRFIAQTDTALGGSPAGGVSEMTWLRKMIEFRSKFFASRNPGAVDRCTAYARVLDAGNLNLQIPFHFSCYGDTCTINGNVGY